MKILVDVHGYPPFHNAGAEWMMHAILKYLKDYHQIIVRLNFNSYLGRIKGEQYEFEGVTVKDDTENFNFYGWADLVFTHLDKTGKAYNECRKHGKPLVHIVHNHHANVVMERMNQVRQYAVYNTAWVRAEREPVNGVVSNSITVHPPVFPKDFECEKINNYTTLIGLSKNKGGDFLIKLAQANPMRRFMGVMGNYATQIMEPTQKNIRYLLNTPEITNVVYRRTRVLIMPSNYESYGRTAIEAISSGIPVICTPTPGLTEALEDAAIYCQRDVGEYTEALKFLDNPVNYKKASEAGIKRAKELNPERELKELNNFINQIHHESTNP